MVLEEAWIVLRVVTGVVQEYPQTPLNRIPLWKYQGEDPAREILVSHEFCRAVQRHPTVTVASDLPGLFGMVSEIDPNTTKTNTDRIQIRAASTDPSANNKGGTM